MKAFNLLCMVAAMSGAPAWSHRIDLNERAQLHARDTPQPPVELTVWDHGGNESSPLLYGIMFEVSCRIIC